MHKHLLLGVLAAAGLTAATFITTRASGSTAKTITFVHVQTSFSAPDNRTRPPRGGDRLTFTNDDVTGGKKIGHDQISCIAVSPHSAQCSATFLLDRGEIVAAGALPLNPTPKVVMLAITGGTGSFAGVHGFLTSTSISQTRSKLALHLL